MIALQDIQRSASLLKSEVIRTPLVYSPSLTTLCGAQVYLKLENLQETGSFKIRGATSKIHFSRSAIGPQGVVAASAGNHAQGVALAARRAGLPATIIMPEWASITKQEATRAYGGEVVLEGQSIGESIEKALELSRTGKLFIHPFDDLEVMAGQGTIGLEILEDLPDPDLIIVPIGGGGLISGIAVAARALRPEVRIVGVQAAACPSARASLQASRIVRVEAAPSIADGITVKQVGALNFPVLQQKIDEVVLVDEDEITAAILLLLDRKKVLAEGAGAVPVAALLQGSIAGLDRSKKVVLVISGGNIDSPLLERTVRQGLFRNGRIMRFSVCLDDRPGTLILLLERIARMKANILHIYHDRSGGGMPLFKSRVELEIETRSPVHILEIVKELSSAGYQLSSRPGDRLPF